MKTSSQADQLSNQIMDTLRELLARISHKNFRE